MPLWVIFSLAHTLVCSSPLCLPLLRLSAAFVPLAGKFIFLVPLLPHIPMFCHHHLSRVSSSPYLATNKPYLVSRRRNTGEVVTESQRVCFMSGNVLSEIDNCVNVSVIVCYCDSLMKLVFVSYGSVVICFLFLLWPSRSCI